VENRPLRRKRIEIECKKAFVDNIDLFLQNLEEYLETMKWRLPMIFFAKAIPKGTKKFPIPHVLLKIEINYDNYLQFRVGADGGVFGYEKTRTQVLKIED
jgi:hypothetical protein